MVIVRGHKSTGHLRELCIDLHSEEIMWSDLKMYRKFILTGRLLLAQISASYFE